MRKDKKKTQWGTETKKLCLYIPIETAEKLEKQCAQRGLTRGAVLHEYLNWLEWIESMNKSGLIAEETKENAGFSRIGIK